jgi:transposase InsO family protein
VSVAFIDTNRQRWPVALMCRVLELSERSYYAAKRRPVSARARADVTHRREIRRVFDANYQVYGARRVWRQLQREGHPIARCTVERLMSDMGLSGVRRGRRPYTTVADKSAPRPPDLVDRRFVAEHPNQLWVADITYVSTWEGWLYVAFVLDVHSRVIVGWQIANHLRTDLVLDAIEMALWRRDTTPGALTHHSDAGCQYVSFRYSERLAEAGIAASIGSVGDSYDNAMAEALNGTYKAELIRRRGPWRTPNQAEFATIEWIDWYNTARLHGELGHVPPAEHEAQWLAAHTPAIMATTQPR